MSRVLFFKIDNCQQTRAQIVAKIAQIDAIIGSLYSTALTSVGNGSMIQYELDTGQSRQKVQYSTTESVTKAIMNYEKIRQMLQNKLSSPSFRLMDAQNLKR
jgi:protein-arginine kinase